jgi:hypothetical protein
VGQEGENAKTHPEPVLELGPGAPWTGPALFAFGIAVFVLALALEARAVALGPTLAKILSGEVTDAGFSISERSASLNLRASMLLLLGATLASVLLSVWSFRLAYRTARGPVLVILGLMGVLGVVGIVLAASPESATGVLRQLVAAVERNSAAFRENGLASLSLLPKDVGESTAVILGAGMACFAVLPRRVDARELAVRARRIRLLLYCGAAMFVFGILVVRTNAIWLLSFFAPAAEGAEAGEFAKTTAGLVSGVTNLGGAFYSLMLAAVYIPTAVVLGRLAERLGKTAAGEDAEPEKIRGWLEERELLVSWRGQLTRVGALLAPVLSSAAVQLLGAAGA